jgi:sulfur carrier protein ThiS
MPAILRPNDALRPYTGGRTEVQVEAGRTVLETLIGLAIPSELVAAVVVNDEMVPKEYIIQEGDRIRILAVIGGG